jgi:hypothetical protein
MQPTPLLCLLPLFLSATAIPQYAPGVAPLSSAGGARGKAARGGAAKAPMAKAAAAPMGKMASNRFGGSESCSPGGPPCAGNGRCEPAAAGSYRCQHCTSLFGRVVVVMARLTCWTDSSFKDKLGPQFDVSW